MVEGFIPQQKTVEQVNAEEHVIVSEADKVDQFAVSTGRVGQPALAPGLTKTYGAENVGWRTEKLPLPHNVFGKFAKEVGIIPVRVVATEAGIEYAHQQTR